MNKINISKLRLSWLKLQFIIINLFFIFIIINCDSADETDKDGNLLNTNIMKYVLGTHFAPTDNLILTEFHRFSGHNRILARIIYSVTFE